MTKVKENLKGLGLEELKKKLIDLEERIRILKFKSEGSKSKNVKESSTLRKEIARILTKINSGRKL